MIIYFSKINLDTPEVFDLYKDEKVFDNIRRSLLSYVHNGAIYKTESFYLGVDGIVHSTTVEYRLSIRKKEDGMINGVIYKETRLYYKQINPDTNEIEPRSVKTIEDVQFYFDIDREIVGFHTRNRFGYKEFNTAFSEILNQCMKENESSLLFTVELYNEGLNISEIESELKSIPNIKRLIFNFKAPNPADENMLRKLADGLDNTVEQLEAANANGMSVIFDSNGKIGLNIEAEEIEKNIKRIGSIHSYISDKEAIKNGYASVKAISNSGKVFTTEEKKPVKRMISDEIDFIDACKDTIVSIFSRKRE